jgi:hypothetical protein
MDARVCARPGCGNPRLPGRKLEDFCTYSCRGQFQVLEAIQVCSGLVGAKNTKQNGLSSRSSSVRRHFADLSIRNRIAHPPGKDIAVPSPTEVDFTAPLRLAVGRLAGTAGSDCPSPKPRPDELAVDPSALRTGGIASSLGPRVRPPRPARSSSGSHPA